MKQWKLEKKIWKLSCEAKNAHIHILGLSNSTLLETLAFVPHKICTWIFPAVVFVIITKKETSNWLDNTLNLRITTGLHNELLSSSENEKKKYSYTQLRWTLEIQYSVNRNSPKTTHSTCLSESSKMNKLNNQWLRNSYICGEPIRKSKGRIIRKFSKVVIS